MKKTKAPSDKDIMDNYLIKIHSDNLSRNGAIYLVIGSLFLICLSFFCSFAELTRKYKTKAPEAGQYKQDIAVDCPLHINPSLCIESVSGLGGKNFSKLKANSWFGSISMLQQLNQMILVMMNLEVTDDPPRNLDLKVKFNYSLGIYAVNHNGDLLEVLSNRTNHSTAISCSFGNSSGSCEKQVQVAYVTPLKHESYLFTLQLLETEPNIFKGIYAKIFIINEEFSKFILAVKYVFLGISILAFIWFVISMRKLKTGFEVIEHKFLKVLGFTLIWFNDPFIAGTLLNPNLFSAFLSSLFFITFFSLLLLFWLVIFERIKNENIQKTNKSLNKPKKIFIFVIWLFALVASNLINYLYLRDPGYRLEDEWSQAYKAFKIISFILLGFYIGWISYLGYGVWKEFETKITRHKIFFIFSLFFMIGTVIYSIDYLTIEKRRDDVYDVLEESANELNIDFLTENKEVELVKF